MADRSYLGHGVRSGKIPERLDRRGAQNMGEAFGSHLYCCCF